jgi:membrane protease YdiL (CAAX protease family)
VEGEMSNRPKVTDVNVLFFIFVVIFLAFQVILVFIAILFSLRYGATYYENFFTDNLYTITLISEFVIILLPVLIFTLVKKLSFKEVFKLNNPGIVPMLLVIPASLGAYFVAMALNAIVIYVLQFIGTIPQTPIPVPTNLRELVTGILVIAVTPAICEEFMHRGLMLSAYERRGSNRALVITSILFGLFHLDITNLLGPIFLGLLIGYYVIRTNSIWVGIFAHFLNNTIAELNQYFFNDPSLTNESVTISARELFSFVLFGIAGFVFLSLIIAAFHAATARKSRPVPPIATIGNDVKSVLTHWPVIIVLVLYVLMAVFYIINIALSGSVV